MIVGPKRVVFMDGPCLAWLCQLSSNRHGELKLKQCSCGCRDLHWVGQQHNVSDREVHPQLLAHDEGAALPVPDMHVPAIEAGGVDRLAARQGTVLMALLQPPPEVYELFDDIMLLSEGMPGARVGFVFCLHASLHVQYQREVCIICLALCSRAAGRAVGRVANWVPDCGAHIASASLVV